MPFTLASFTRIGSVPNGTTGAGRAGQSADYKYVHATDTNATIIAAGYFNAVRDQLQKGDVIQIVGTLSTTPTIDHAVVTAVPAAPGNVTVARETDV